MARASRHVRPRPPSTHLINLNRRWNEAIPEALPSMSPHMWRMPSKDPTHVLIQNVTGPSGLINPSEQISLLTGKKTLNSKFLGAVSLDSRVKLATKPAFAV
jgi:hypothetical protein